VAAVVSPTVACVPVTFPILDFVSATNVAEISSALAFVSASVSLVAAAASLVRVASVTDALLVKSFNEAAVASVKAVTSLPV